MTSACERQDARMMPNPFGSLVFRFKMMSVALQQGRVRAQIRVLFVAIAMTALLLGCAMIAVFLSGVAPLERIISGTLLAIGSGTFAFSIPAVSIDDLKRLTALGQKVASKFEAMHAQEKKWEALNNPDLPYTPPWPREQVMHAASGWTTDTWISLAQEEFDMKPASVSLRSVWDFLKRRSAA